MRRERAKRWKGYEHNPVFDQAEVAKMASAGIQRLADMQLSDGGWGWFSGFGEYASPHTTALVVHGLQIARQNDLTLPHGMLERGVAWLTAYQAKQVRSSRTASARSSRTRSGRRPRCARLHGPDRRRSQATTRCSAFSTAIARTFPSMPRPCSAWRSTKLGEKDKLAAVLQNIEPVRRAG